MSQRGVFSAVGLVFVACWTLHAGGPAYNSAVLQDDPLYCWTFDEPGDLDEAVNQKDLAKVEDRLLPQGAATRVDHEAIGSDPILGRCADFDGANSPDGGATPGSRFHAPDLKGGGGAGGPGIDVVASQLWVLEFWFQVKGSTEGNRADYFLEVIDPGGSNDPGIIYDYTPEDYIEMFRGERTGAAGPQVHDNAWHHAVFAFYGDRAGLGVANRREIIIDGGDFAAFSWSLVSGDATISDKGGGTAEVVGNSEGTVVVRVDAGDGVCLDGASDEHTIVCGGGAPVFHRADPNNDGACNITDGIYILNYLFLGGPPPTCKESADANNDRAVNITDGIYVLNYLFLGGPPPAPPAAPGRGECGPDTDAPGTPGDLGCETYTKCGP
jgi:hypothetical protein